MIKNALLLLIRKHTGTLIQQTKTEPQETLEFKLHKQWETFSCNPPINISEKGKRFLAVTIFKATHSVFNVSHENISFLVTITGYKNTKSVGKNF